VTVFTDRFATLAPRYDVVLSDVWGVTHNGLTAFPAACAALAQFRRGGGTVVLITNAPRPGAVVADQLDRFGVPREAYDDIVSSGDVTRGVVAGRPGQSIFHLGPPRDIAIFDDLNCRFLPLEQADYVICTGLFDDETETPEDYRPQLVKMRERALFMVCGNPDVVVERGDKLVYCAGAVCDLYREMGGDVLYAGKPYRPIYEEALRKAQAKRGKPTLAARTLAIGDSLRTDVRGAQALGIDCLFVTAGIHAEELGGRDDPRPEALEKMFAAADLRPTAVTKSLRW
jgi:HAD superfamily hydrolase (TIGR01459 family)